jgi:dipeptidyl aminopeptidase/acylaminoacyl peptidase
MKLSRWLMAACVATAAVLATAIERLPVEDFSRDAVMSRARLSPDGRRVAFVKDFQGRSSLHIFDLEAKKVSRLDLGEAAMRNDATKDVGGFLWVSDKRLVITTVVRGSFYGVIAVDWDGNRPTPISGHENPKLRLEVAGNVATMSMESVLRETIHAFYDKAPNILMLDRHEIGGGGGANRPDIVRMNTSTGVPTTVLKNPGEVAHYGVDFDGVPRFGILSHGELSGAIYRGSEKEPWKTVLPLERREGQMRPLGFDASTNRLLVTKPTPEKRWAIYAVDPATSELTGPLMSDPEYDIVPQRHTPSIDGVPLAGPVFSRSKRALVGIRYYNEAPRTKWLDKEFARYQLVVDKALPDTVNILVDQSADGKKLLWLGFSDQDPGIYCVLDVEKKDFKPVNAIMPWIKPAQMAPMLSVKYAARDGLVIHGYLTVPVGHQPKDLPLIVMPHGGPWVRDDWGYDRLVQLLANRGYAVLQMNYRGSTGYGDELYREARREIGGKIQDDIEDATRWAIAAGVADPQRIAIMGASYGGYSTLFGLGRSPELYRCGIAVMAVTDWPAIYEDSDVAESKAATKYWREQIGDPAKDKDLARLQAASPVNFADKIVAPVLIIQGKQDERVPQDQAKRMVAALEKAGRKPESLFMANMGHNYGNQTQRTEIYKRIVAFLETNLGPGVP